MLLALLWAVPAQARDVIIVMLSRAEDPFYQAGVGNDGVARPAVPRPFAGAALAVRDVRAIARATGIEVRLETLELKPDADAAQAVREMSAMAVIADLMGDDLLSAARAADGKLAMFNIRDDRDALRRDACGLGLFHIPASVTGQTDALAQFVVRRNWKNVLLLTGPLPEDRALAGAFMA